MCQISAFLSENFQFSEVKISVYLNRRVFVMMKTDVDLIVSVPDFTYLLSY